MANIAELRERKSGLYDYEYNLRKLIEDSQAKSHSYIVSGQAALQAVAKEQGEIDSRVTEETAAIERTQGAISRIAQEIAALDAEVAGIRDKCLLLQNREQQLHAASEALLHAEAVRTVLEPERQKQGHSARA
jgi:3-methyladenine DNA glycosylase/8-oxoguanine DNA glycosylase